MEATNPFEEAIKAYITEFGDKYPIFKERVNEDKRTLQDCCNYILATVKESGRQGFDDEEIFSMVRHFWDEPEIKAGDVPSGVKVITNYKVELTDEDKEEAKRKAIAEVTATEKRKVKEEIKKSISDEEKDKIKAEARAEYLEKEGEKARKEARQEIFDEVRNGMIKKKTKKKPAPKVEKKEETKKDEPQAPLTLF